MHCQVAWNLIPSFQKPCLRQTRTVGHSKYVYNRSWVIHSPILSLRINSFFYSQLLLHSYLANRQPFDTNLHSPGKIQIEVTSTFVLLLVNSFQQENDRKAWFHCGIIEPHYTTYNVCIHTQKWMVHLRNYKKSSIAQAWVKGIMAIPVP